MDIDLKGSSSLLGSRICHDLISPLGAISNGLELLAMSEQGKSPELKLVEEAIASANARVRFFRVAFGASSGSQVMARSEILNLIDDSYSTGRIKLRWDVAHDPTRTATKISLLAVLCLELATAEHGVFMHMAPRSGFKKNSGQAWMVMNRSMQLQVRFSSYSCVRRSCTLT